jgi:hypothetical protein
MSAHFDLRRDAAGWTVFDRWTGKTVVLGLTAQIGLAFANAEELVRKLNERGDPEERRILQ